MQRVRVRWSAASRGASHANARRGLCRPAALPSSLPPGELVLHDVPADEATGYARHDSVSGGGADRSRDAGLWLTVRGPALVADRFPGREAYPRRSGPTRLFTLIPGQTGRYRGNFRFRFTECECDPSWYYEDWLVQVCHGAVTGGGFAGRAPDHEVDHRVHLYGGSRRRV